MADNNLDAIKPASEQLERATHVLAEAMYKATAAAAGQGQGPGAPGPEGDGASSQQSSTQQQKPQGDVIDAEFVDVDESKKPN